MHALLALTSKRQSVRAKVEKSRTNRYVDSDRPVLNQTWVLTGSSALKEVAVRFWRSDVGHAVLAAVERNEKLLRRMDDLNKKGQTH